MFIPFTFWSFIGICVAWRVLTAPIFKDLKDTKYLLSQARLENEQLKEEVEKYKRLSDGFSTQRLWCELKAEDFRD